MLPFLLTLLVALPPAGDAAARPAKAKILLIGKDRDHAFTTHEYMADCRLLAKCLEQTEGVETVVSNGWPKDPAVLEGVRAVVLHTQMGGDVLFHEKNREQAEALVKKGVGLVAIHWATGASVDARGEAYLKAMGGWFNTKFSRYLVKKTMLKRADPSHPVNRGWKDYELREEYYIKLKFVPEAKPVFTTTIDGEDYAIGWVYERPDGGRSFGTVGGHFHANFGIEGFRRGIVNGILWSAGVEIPEGGAPCAISDADMELPPDTRKKKK